MICLDIPPRDPRDPAVVPSAHDLDPTEPPSTLFSAESAAPSVGRLHYGYSEADRREIARQEMANMLADLVAEHGYLRVMAALERMEP